MHYKAQKKKKLDGKFIYNLDHIKLWLIKKTKEKK